MSQRDYYYQSFTNILFSLFEARERAEKELASIHLRMQSAFKTDPQEVSNLKAALEVQINDDDYW